MSLVDVENEILGPMQRLFLPPRNMEEGQQTEALREYGNALQDFAAADLKASWQAVRDTHTTRGWPVPAAFILAARQARKDRNPAAGPARMSEQVQQNAAWDRWQAVRKTPLALEAVRRNVAWSLKCAILGDKKRPEEVDLRQLVIGKASAEEFAAKLERGEVKMKPGVLKPALDMWRTLLIREAETQQEIRERAA